MVLVGNKIDLENQRVITEKRGRKVYVHVYMCTKNSRCMLSVSSGVSELSIYL